MGGPCFVDLFLDGSALVEAVLLDGFAINGKKTFKLVYLQKEGPLSREENTLRG